MHHFLSSPASHPWILPAHGHKWQILRGCGLTSLLRQDEITQCRTYTHTHTHGHKHRCTGVCHSHPHALTHWLADFVMGLSLTHWLCYVTTTESAPPPSSPPSPSLSAPPCIHAVFSREAPALHPSPSSSSGGWKWGARGKGREEDVWRAQGGDLTSLSFGEREGHLLFFSTCIQ